MNKSDSSSVLKESKWDIMYRLAKDYYDRNGNLRIPMSYVTEHGVKLGRWINNMIRAYQGKGTIGITPEQIEKLEKIGIVWKRNNIAPASTWEDYYELAREYYLEHGNLDAAPSYMTEYGVRLGRWIFRMRQDYVKKYRNILTEPRIKKLEDIGMNWFLRERKI